MKHIFITQLLFLIIFSSHSQNTKFEYSGRFTATVKSEDLKEAKFIGDISADVFRKLGLPPEESRRLNQLLDHSGISIFPPGNYNKIIDFVSVILSAECKGKAITATSPGDNLSAEQINMLNKVDLGSDIYIDINFKFKKEYCYSPADENKIMQGRMVVTVIPATEAEFPGGFKQFSTYYQDKVFSKFTDAASTEKIQNASIRFTVNEKGQVVDPKIGRTSSDPKIDKQILESTKKMPLWKPAENPKGVKVSEEFEILFGSGGC